MQIEKNFCENIINNVMDVASLFGGPKKLINNIIYNDIIHSVVSVYNW